MDATVEIDDPSRRGAFFGPADRNLRLVRAAFEVRITARDGLLRLSGPERAVQATAKCLADARRTYILFVRGRNARKECARCGREARYKCATCRSARYCDARCKEGDARIHSHFCRPPPNEINP